jgi:hypothetical protein
MGISTIKGPALPLSPMVYDRQYVDQVNTILRIYFSQLDNVTSQLYEVSNSTAVINWMTAHI